MDLSKFGVEVKKDILEVKDSKLDVDFDQIKEDFKKEDIDRYLPWFLKYSLDSLDDLIETKEIKKVRLFFDSFQKENGEYVKTTQVAQKIRSKGLLLVGMPGSGKTTTLNLFGEKYNYEIFELNASDARNKKSIEQSIGDVIKQKSLFGQEKLILIDEADGVSGTNDRGGLAEIVKYLKLTNYPIVFTANDKDSDKIKAIKKITTVVDFEAHSYELLNSIAKKILTLENIEFNQKDLDEFIGLRDTADIRGFINDLQASIFDDKFKLSQDLELRDYKKKIENILDKIFYSYPQDALKSTFNSDVNIDDLILYLEENIPIKYRGTALNLAFNEISKADVFRGRILKWQHWKYLVYVFFYSTFAISEAKGNQSLEKGKWEKNSRILKKWIYSNKVGSLQPRTKLQKQKEDPLKLIEKISNKYKCSVKKTRTQIIPYILINWKNDNHFKNNLIKEFEMNSAEIKCLDELK